MHSAARGARSVFGISVALTILGCVLAVPTAAGAARDPEPAVAAARDAELVRLSDEAKDEFRTRMYPSAAYVNYVNVAEGEPTQAARAYALRSFESAIDALLAEAHRSPEGARAVEAALRRFVARGKTDATDAIFSDVVERETAGGQVGARPAAAIRNSVALAELPAALAPLIRWPFEALPFPPLGEKALPAYRRAAELDPDEPWTWIAIAWMGEASAAATEYWKEDPTGPIIDPLRMREAGDMEIAEVESALDKGEAAASAGREDDAAIAALHVRARVRLAQGRLDEAERALLAAVRLAEERARVEPDLQANLALCLSLAGDFYARQADHGRAATAYRGAFEIRQHLAAAAPNDEAKQQDLAASHFRLAVLAGKTGAGTEANDTGRR
jgi:tetratricopeptide (TPR) repeat protein